MRKQQFNQNMTFSLPRVLKEELHLFVERNHLSRFVQGAIEKALAEEKERLKKQIIQANHDPGQLEAKEDWKFTLMDGLE